jgi:hypothetical protein
MEDVYTSALTESTFQADKLLKHMTTPSTSSRFVTVFDSTDLGEYREYIVSAKAAGVVEIDEKDQRNILWVCWRKIGYAFAANGVLEGPVDGLAIVLSSNPAKVHLFPRRTEEFVGATCTSCKGPAITSAAATILDTPHL